MVNKQINKIEEINKCPECDSKELTRDDNRAELVCNNCGLVIDEDLIDYGPEWRAFDHEQREKRARTGAPMTPLMHDKGLTTTIDWKNRDFYGRSIPNRNRARVYRLRKWQKRLRSSQYQERNLIEALQHLDRMSSSLELPRSVRENAAVIYRKAVDKNLIRGRSIDGVVASTIYAACRQCGVPRTLDEISDKTNIKRKEIGRNYRHINKALKLNLKPTAPKDYITRFSSDLDLGSETKSKALKILKKANKKELTSGRGPIGLAAASLYMASVLSGEKRTQKEISETSGVTEVTIRNRYKELADVLGIKIAV